MSDTASQSTMMASISITAPCGRAAIPNVALAGYGGEKYSDIMALNRGNMFTSVR